MKKIIRTWNPEANAPPQRVITPVPKLKPQQEIVNLALHSLARQRIVYSGQSERLAALIKEFNKRLITKPVASIKKIINLWLNQ